MRCWSTRTTFQALPGVPAPTEPQTFTWSFPVKLPCAVRELSFYVHVYQPAASAALYSL